MNASSVRRLFLVLASRRSFEALVGPVPNAWIGRFRFQKARNALRIRSLLPRCRLVISKNYCRPDCNRWIFEARRMGVPTLLLIDGPLEWSNLYSNPSLAALGQGVATGLFEPIVHDAVATIGDAQTRWIAGSNDGRGITWLRYANQRVRTGTIVETAGSRPEFDFLLTTARTPCFDDREKAALAATLGECAAALEGAGHRTLVRIFDGDLRATVDSRAPSFTFETGRRFAEALARVRCVIGTPSSVLLESMHHGRPTGLLLFRDRPLFYEAGWLLGRREDWKASFATMLARDPIRMERQRHVLRENVSDESFFERCERIAAREVLDAPRPLDALDLEFFRRVGQHRGGWPARWIA